METPKRLLVFTRQLEYVHESTDTVIDVITTLGRKNNWVVTASQDPACFDDEEVLKASYDVIIFAQTSGDVLNEKQQEVFYSFLFNNKKGFVGIHAAADALRKSQKYRDILGATFVGHPPPQKGKVVFNVEASKALGLQLPSSYTWEPVDEWYNFDRNVKDLPGYTIVATVDESTYNTEEYERKEWEGTKMGAVHPLIWHHEFGQSRSFYCALGHPKELYQDPILLSIIHSAIRWVIN